MACTAVNSQCKDYNISTGECTSCFTGYIINNKGQCIIAEINDTNCKNRDSITGKCINCYSGFFFSQQYSKCIPLNPLCRGSNLTDGSCLTCYPGYAIINGTCILTFLDPNCRQFNSTNCLICSLGFFLDTTGKCRQVSPLCKIFNTTTGFCLGCYPGYSLSKGNCLVNSGLISVDPNCMSQI
jgi:proprotein convertase subtilisin/kexin type 5